MPAHELRARRRPAPSDARRTAARRARRRRPRPTPVAGATSVRERRFAGRKSTGGAPARLRLSVSGGRASRKIVALRSISASRWMRPPDVPRETSSIVGGGAAASSSVQIAVSTVDLPLDASPTSAHIEPRLELERRAQRDSPGSRSAEQRHVAHGAQSAPRYTAGSPGSQRRRKRWIGGWSTTSSSSARVEEPVAAHGGVLRRDRLERAAGEIAGEDDVDDVLRRERALRRDRVDERDRALDRRSRPRCRPPRAARGAARRRGSRPPLTPPPGSSQYSPRPAFSWRQRRMRSCPAQHRRDADARLERHQAVESRSRARRARCPGSSSTSTGSAPATGMTTSCAIRMPGSTTNVSLGVGVQQDDLQLAAVAGVDEARRVHDRDPVLRREPRARLDEAGVARPGSRPRARCRPVARSPGAELDALARREVEPRVAGVRAHRARPRRRAAAESGARSRSAGRLGDEYGAKRRISRRGQAARRRARPRSCPRAPRSARRARTARSACRPRRTAAAAARARSARRTARRSARAARRGPRP